MNKRLPKEVSYFGFSLCIVPSLQHPAQPNLLEFQYEMLLKIDYGSFLDFVAETAIFHLNLTAKTGPG